jgi:hypothetical protein
MAACLSPSPSGRRLSELLEEKQQPFLLDIHLLEKGCSSPRFLDAYDTAAMCWPAPVLKRLTSKKNGSSHRHHRQDEKRQNQKPAGGLIKLLLSKILPGKAARGPKPPALQFAADSFMEKETTQCSNSDSCSSESYSSSDDGEKQLSPVSVLDRTVQSSPVHANNGKMISPSRKAAMDVLQELLDAALLARSDDLAIKDTDDDDEEYCYHDGYRTTPKNNGGRYDDDAAYWAELARVSALAAAEVPSARLDAAVQPEREDVGAGVADAVLHALVQELVVDLGSC